MLISRISGYFVSKGEPGEVSNALQRSWRFMWDDAEPTLRLRVAGALLCMVGAKLMSIQVPFLFKAAVDLLGVDATDGGGGTLVAAALTPTALMLLYGLTRASADGLTQLRNALFVQVTEGALRRMARRTFRHLHSMELRFHLNRQTGALSRVIERGTRAVGTLLSTTVLQAAAHRSRALQPRPLGTGADPHASACPTHPGDPSRAARVCTPPKPCTPPTRCCNVM